jgi:hypothetical protein
MDLYIISINGKIKCFYFILQVTKAPIPAFAGDTQPFIGASRVCEL